MGTLEVLAETTSKAENVYNALLEKIVDGDYPPGYSLSIREISQQIEVSRTPVKEAFSRLVYDGYVEPLPNRSFIVARISTTEVLELLDRHFFKLALCKVAGHFLLVRLVYFDSAGPTRTLPSCSASASITATFPSTRLRRSPSGTKSSIWPSPARPTTSRCSAFWKRSLKS